MERLKLKVVDDRIFQDCYDIDAKLLVKIKSFLKFLIVPKFSAEKICPWVRIGMRLRKYKLNLLSDWCHYRLLKKFNCVISFKATIGPKLFLPHPIGVVIGRDVKIGEKATIYQGVTIGQSKGIYPVIGNNVIIYAGAKIVGDVHIGNNVIIGANSVVVDSVPDNTIVAGIPAKVIKTINQTNNYR